MTTILVFFAAHWLAAVLAQTLFLHRYASHGYFTMAPFWERAAYFFTMIAQGPSFLNPRAYALMHRMHHAYSDTARDPHSPVQQKSFFKMMWQTALTFDGIQRGKITVPEKFEGPRTYGIHAGQDQGASMRYSKIPVWPLLDRLSGSWFYRIGAGSLYAFFYMAFVPAGSEWLYALLPLHWLMGPIHGAMVNWAGHMYGYVNYKNSKDHSKNTLPIDFLIGGELYQNNHHGRANSPNFAKRWFEIDFGYQVLRVLSWIGIVRFPEKKPVPHLTKLRPITH